MFHLCSNGELATVSSVMRCVPVFLNQWIWTQATQTRMPVTTSPRPLVPVSLSGSPTPRLSSCKRRRCTWGKNTINAVKTHKSIDTLAHKMSLNANQKHAHAQICFNLRPSASARRSPDCHLPAHGPSRSQTGARPFRSQPCRSSCPQGRSCTTPCTKHSLNMIHHSISRHIRVRHNQMPCRTIVEAALLHVATIGIRVPRLVHRQICTKRALDRCVAL